MFRPTLRFALSALLLLSGPLASATRADEPVDIAVGLQSFSRRLGDLGAFGAFNDRVPLTELSAAGDEGLRLAQLFEDTLEAAMATAPPTLEELAAAIESAGDANYQNLGLSIGYLNVVVVRDSADPQRVNVSFDISVSRSTSFPIRFADAVEPVDLRGGGMTLDLGLTASFEFQLDTGQSVPSEAFYLSALPQITLTVEADAAVEEFSHFVGFGEVAVSGNATLSLTLEANFADPDGDGRLTEDEWESTALADLVNLAFHNDAGPEVQITVNLDSALIPGSPDGVISLIDQNPTDGLAAPSLTLGVLDDLTNIDPTEVLNGLAALAASIGGAELSSDAPLPFLDRSLSDVVEFAGPLLSFLQQQSEAAVTCGNIDDDPPRGNIVNLSAGDEFFCQATGLDAPAVVEWVITSGDAMLVSGGTDLATAGANPTATARFQMTSVGTPDVTLRFKTDASATEFREVARLFLSAEELLAKLAGLAGFDGAAENLRYDATTRSLRVRLRKSFDPPAFGDDASERVSLDFADQLKSATGLASLDATAGASATIDPQDIGVDLEFGILLVADAADITPDDDPPGELDRFFVHVSPDQPEFAADVQVQAAVDLSGRIGMLEVRAAGDGAANSHTPGTAFEIGRGDPALPMFSIEVLPTPGGIPVEGIAAITDVILVRDLLRNIATQVTPDINIEMSGGLRVTAGVTSPPLALAGSVSIHWPDVTSGSPTITTEGFDDLLKLFDTDPSLFGTHTGSAGAASLTDSSQDFTTAGELIGRSLRNLTDDSRCVITALDGTDTIECTLGGGTNNLWNLGDEYELIGNPLDMLSLILDNIDAIVRGVDGLTGGAVGTVFRTKLPLVGVSPEDLLDFITDLEAAVEEIRTGDARAQILCRRAEVPDADEDGAPDFAAENLTNLSGGEVVRCKALAADSAQSVTWSIVDLVDDVVPAGNAGTNTSGAGALTTVGPSPKGEAEFTVTAGGTAGTHFKIRVDFTQSGGVARSAEIPDEAFTLQSLERLLETKLGLPANAFQLEIMDLPAPVLEARSRLRKLKAIPASPAGAEVTVTAVGDGVPDLVIRLGFGQCTSGNSVVTCDPNDRLVDPLRLNINLGLEGLELPGLVGLSADDPAFILEYAARAQFDFAIPLDPSLDSDAVVVVDTSGVEMEISARAKGFNLRANVGPVAVDIGGVAKVGAQFIVGESVDNGVDNDETFALDDWLDALSAELTGVDVDCGSTTQRFEGTHGGADNASALVDGDLTRPYSNIWIGATLRNVTDGSECTVTAVSGGDTLTCTLAGGTENDWDLADEFELSKSFALAGDACAALTLSLVDPPTALGTLGFKATDLNDPDDLSTFEKWFATPPQNLLNCVDLDALALDLLFEAFEFLIEQLDSILQGGGPNIQLPLIGSRLDGGAGVCGSMSQEGGLLDSVQELRETLLNTAPAAIRSTIQTELCDALGDLLKNNLSENDPDHAVVDCADIHVGLDCGSADCDFESDPPVHDLLDLQDIRVTFIMGQGGFPECLESGTDCASGEPDVPLDLGLPGVPLRFRGSLEPRAGWRLLVDFGLSRTQGPYLVAGGDGHGDDAELQLGAGVGLGGSKDVLCGPDVGIPELDENWSSEDGSCLEGSLAFLSVNLRDGIGTGDNQPRPTALTLSTELDITSGSDRIGLQQLLDGDVGLALRVEADAHVDLRFHASAGEPPVVIPSVLGTFTLDWPIGTFEFDTNDGSRFELGFDDLSVMFDNLYLDPGAFFQDFVGPLVSGAADVTRPFRPIIDTVRAPIPLVSDLSKLVGGPNISMLTLMEAYNGGPLPMIRNIIEILEFIDSIDELVSNTGMLPLGGPDLPGSFEIDTTRIRRPQTPDSASRSIMNQTRRSNLTGEITGGVSRTPASLSFPFLEDSSQIFGLLMGQDITLLRFDAGEMRAVANIGPFTYCCIPVGPVPVSVFIGGSATLAGRFAAGYDTVGLRQAFSREDPSAGEVVLDILDGLFIDDLDASGQDVPEISLIGEVRAGAGVDIGFAAAGLEGGIRLTVDLNLDDRPEPDGKLRVQEVLDRLSNPICLFEVSGRLEAFLGAWVRVGFEWFSKTWRFEIVNITLLEFSAACAPPQPQPATLESNNLVINIGNSDRRNRRRFNTDETKEEVVIRQLNLEATSFSVALMGFYEEYHGITGSIMVDGDSGDDVISLAPGVLKVENAAGCPAPGLILGKCRRSGEPCASDPECPRSGDVCELPTENFDCIIPFTRQGIISGGAGNDRITGGGGNDILCGGGRSGTTCLSDDGDGNDKISGGDGDDTVDGGGGDDVLGGDAGNDRVFGRNGGDTITGGPDSTFGTALIGDVLDGGGGDDDLNGGPGTNSFDAPGLSPDGNDLLIGGAGNDIVQGFFGDDFAFGDEELGCSDAGAASGGNDKIDGGPGHDRLFGGNGDDTLGGEEGDDIICGNGGSDLIDGDDTDSATADGADQLFGGPGNDQLSGRRGHDRLFGEADNDALYGEEGADDLIGGPGRDILVGGVGRDILLGDSGSIADHDDEHSDADLLLRISRFDGKAFDDIVEHCVVTLDFHQQPFLPARTNGNSDCLIGGDESDFLFGEAGHDRMFGDALEGECQQMVGTPHRDYMEGNSGNDVMRGGIDDDVMFGNDGNDQMFGDSGFDRMCGGDGDDLIRGGREDDLTEGNEGDDTLFGDGGQDDLIGGSSAAGRPDGDDLIFGNAENDVIIGDNGTITRTGGIDPADGTIRRIVRLFDVPCKPGIGGDDEIHGNAGNDDIYGQCAHDLLHGEEGHDYLEGNAGDDRLFGDDGQDDLIGGTARIVSNDDATAIDGRADGDDELHGGSGDEDEAPDDFDLLAGDNAVIDRPVDASGHWMVNSFNAGVVRRVGLLDVGAVGHLPAPGSAGADRLFGEGSDDILHGQGGNDFLSGGTGEDYLEGNADSDDMEGNQGNDDLIGGTGRVNDDPASGKNGRLDGSDVMRGDSGFDVMTGDNAVIARLLNTQGGWQVDPNTGGVIRTVILLDIEPLSAPIVSALVRGSDRMFGGDDGDRMFGQGNREIDHEGDGRVGEDPADGVDNDRDGREDVRSAAYDCRDRADNDGDRLVDADDPDCTGAIDEDGGGDEMHGGAGPDYMEGNHGADWMFGDEHEDDILGGNSAGDGIIGGGVPPTDLRDGDDVISGGDEDDVILADNGVIVRPVDASGRWRRLTGFGFDFAIRETDMARSPESGGGFGNDYLRGDGGHDDLYGQQGDDYAEGNQGEDAILGDLGRITTSINDGSAQQTIAIPAPFIEQVIFVEGTLHRLTELYAFQDGDGVEHADILLGGDGRDSLHGGAGDDLLNGDGDSVDGTDPLAETDDFDRVFGGDGNDVIWGARGHDHLWGGYGDDYLDVRPRSPSDLGSGDPPTWFTYGVPDNYLGLDLIYGGWDQDAMQADVAAPGPVEADRLIDWAGGFNVYYLCPAAYGEGTITRQPSPLMQRFLQDLAEADGALDPSTSGTSGFRELGLVFPRDMAENSHQPHPDHPGHFTCDTPAKAVRIRASGGSTSRR